MPRFNRSRNRNAVRRRGKRSTRRLSVSRFRRGVRNVRNRRVRVSLARRRSLKRFPNRSRANTGLLNQLKQLMPRVNVQLYNAAGLWDGPVNTVGNDIECNYFTPVFNLTTQNPIDTLSITAALSTAYFSLDPTAQGLQPNTDTTYVRGWAPKWFQSGTSVTTTLTNTANHPVLIECYTCQVRQDTSYAGYGNNILEILYDGFRENRETINDGVVGGTSAGLTPFESQRFVTLFKVVSVKKHNLLPGRPRHYMLRKRKRVLWNMARYVHMEASQNIDQSNRLVGLRQYSMFHLFKVIAPLGLLTSAPTTSVTQLNSRIIWQTKYKHGWQRTFDNRKDVSILTMGGDVDLAVNSTAGLGSVREPYDMDYKAETFT